jgi:hypothetical protein
MEMGAAGFETRFSQTVREPKEPGSPKNSNSSCDDQRSLSTYGANAASISPVVSPRRSVRLAGWICLRTCPESMWRSSSGFIPSSQGCPPSCWGADPHPEATEGGRRPESGTLARTGVAARAEGRREQERVPPPSRKVRGCSYELGSFRPVPVSAIGARLPLHHGRTSSLRRLDLRARIGRPRLRRNCVSGFHVATCVHSLVRRRSPIAHLATGSLPCAGHRVARSALLARLLAGAPSRGPEKPGEGRLKTPCLAASQPPNPFV